MPLQELDLIFEIAIMVVGIPAAIFAIIQLMEMRKQRAAEMSWKLFEKHSSPEIQSSRDALYSIIDNFSNSKEYKQKYHDQPLDSEAKSKDKLVRFRIRYFHQVGLLVRKKLVDNDLLFGLIGYSLKDDYEALKIIIDSSKQAHNAPRLYDHVEYLYKRLLEWEKNN